MVQNGEAKCHRRTFSGIHEKAISEDNQPCTKVLIILWPSLCTSETPNFMPLIDCLTFFWLSGNIKTNASFSKEAAADAADYGHPRNHGEHQILSPVPEVSYQDSNRTLRILSNMFELRKIVTL